MRRNFPEIAYDDVLLQAELSVRIKILYFKFTLSKEAFMAMNYSYLISETVEDRSWLKEVAVILGASIIIALFAPISIRLPFTPVPIAVQAHVVLLLSCFLGVVGEHDAALLDELEKKIRMRRKELFGRRGS